MYWSLFEAPYIVSKFTYVRMMFELCSGSILQLTVGVIAFYRMQKWSVRIVLTLIYVIVYSSSYVRVIAIHSDENLLEFYIENLVSILQFKLFSILFIIMMIRGKDIQAEKQIDSIRQSLKNQESVYKILDGLNIAIMEMDAELTNIGFCNQKANKLMK